MQEYLFNKEDLRKLIEESGEDQNRIAVTIDLERPQDGVKARAIKFEPGKTIQKIADKDGFTTMAAAPATRVSDGCPNPPGC